MATISDTEQGVLRCFAAAAARADLSGVLRVDELVEQSGLETAEVSRAITSLVDRGWLVVPPGDGLRRHDLCLLLDEGRDWVNSYGLAQEST
jgi:DNA-binding MarR family transcriptional regulator